MQSRKIGVLATIATTALLLAAQARAEEAIAPLQPAPIVEEERPTRLALRGLLGLGGGNIGSGGFLSLHGEYWLGSVVGIAGQYGSYAQETLEIFGEENHSSGSLAATTLALRTAPGKTYAFLTLGPGIATEAHVTRAAGGVFGGSPGPEGTANATYPLFTGSAGVVWNPAGPVQLGLGLHMYQSVKDFSFLALAFHVGGVG